MPHEDAAELEARIAPLRSIKHSINDDDVTTSTSKDDSKDDASPLRRIDLIVAGAVGYGVVYQDLDQCHLSAPCLLPKSSSHDSVLCTRACDTNWSGRKEVIVGTYGQELLVYRTLMRAVSDKGLEKNDKKIREETRTKTDVSEYVLNWQRTFASPLYSIHVHDFDGDGVKELVVVTLQGVHVLKPDLNQAAARIAAVVEVMEEIGELKKALNII